MKPMRWQRKEEANYLSEKDDANDHNTVIPFHVTRRSCNRDPYAQKGKGKGRRFRTRQGRYLGMSLRRGRTREGPVKGEGLEGGHGSGIVSIKDGPFSRKKSIPIPDSSCFTTGFFGTPQSTRKSRENR